MNSIFTIVIIVAAVFLAYWYYKKVIGEDFTANSNTSKSEDFTEEDDGWEAGRYTALKTIVGLLNTLGYLMIIVGVIAAMMLLSDKNYEMGIMSLIGGILFALPLLAFSNLIYVFVDIEYNTRKTREAVSEMNKQSKA